MGEEALFIAQLHVGFICLLDSVPSPRARAVCAFALLVLVACGVRSISLIPAEAGVWLALIVRGSCLRRNERSRDGFRWRFAVILNKAGEAGNIARQPPRYGKRRETIRLCFR